MVSKKPFRNFFLVKWECVCGKMGLQMLMGKRTLANGKPFVTFFISKIKFAMSVLTYRALRANHN